MIEDEYLRNCTRGRHGYQTGELSDARKSEIKDEFLKQLAEDPDCPLWGNRWSNTIVPVLCFHLPIRTFKWLRWRIINHKQIEEEKRKAYEERRRIEEETRKEEE